MNRFLTALIVVSLFAIEPPALFAQASEIDANADFIVAPEVFPVFPWDTLRPTKASYDEARACGFNLAGFVHPEDLDTAAASKLKAFVSDPSIEVRGATLSDEEITSRAKALAEKTAKNPATFGYHVIDEPPKELMPTVIKWTRALQEAAPNAIAYTNLLPMGGATPAGLSEAAWEKYLRSYLDAVKPKAFSYDFYSFFDDGNVRANYFSGLEIARKVSVETNTPFWHVALANTHFRYAEPSAAIFRFQIFTSLAYGVRGMGWFTYTGRDRGNYRDAAIDLFGHRTPTYDLLRDANLQLHRLAPHITKLKSVNVFHHPDIPRACKPLDESRFLADVKGAGPFCVGEFEDEQGRPAVLVVNRDLVHSTQMTIVPKMKTAIQRVSSYSGKVRPWGAEDNWLPPGGGVLLLLHD